MKHIKTATNDYYVDDQDKLQGESKSYWPYGELQIHCFYLDDRRHGEYKSYHDNGKLYRHGRYVNGFLQGEYKVYYESGQLARHHFYLENVDVTNEVKLLVRDLSNITSEEKVILKLQLGLDI